MGGGGGERLSTAPDNRPGRWPGVSPYVICTCKSVMIDIFILMDSPNC